jgi:hypothetical protein
VLSLLAAIDPVRIALTALFISRPRPMLNLLVFWLGGMVEAIAVALVVLVTFRDFTLSVMRAVVSATSSPIVIYIQVVIGVLAVSFAARIVARFWPRQRAPMPVTKGRSAVLVLEPDTSTGSGRPSMRGALEGRPLMLAFAAGLALATPPVEYMAAIIAIVASEPNAPAQVGAALIFTLIAFTVVEVPLITYLATPTHTLAVVRRLNDWISARRQAIPAFVVGAIGFLLLLSGVGRV